MKISKHFEQAIYVLLILASQRENLPLKSTVLSSLLDVSDSSLKKVLRDLVVAGFIKSSASKDGGFVLSCSLSTVTLTDVLLAIESSPVIDYKTSNLGEKIFPDAEHARLSQQSVVAKIKASEQSFLREMSKMTLAELLLDEALQGDKINWLKNDDS